MRQRDFEEALEALGERCPPGTEIYLAGGAALIFRLYAHRAGDVQDLESMALTEAEVDWMLDHLDGAAAMNPHKVPKMRATLRRLDPRSREGRTP